MMFNWFSFLIYAVITAVTPGPNNIMSMSNGNKKGFIGALPFNMGILVGFSSVMILCTVFCNLFSEWIPKIKMPMLIIGACYILHLAWATFRSSSEIKTDNTELSGFLSGIFLQFINPKIYIYCIISMKLYIFPVYSDQYLQLFYFAILLAFIGFIFNLLWTAFGVSFKLIFCSHPKFINSIMGLLLVYCAISLFIN